MSQISNLYNYDCSLWSLVIISGGISVQILYLSKSTKATLWKYPTTSKSAAFLTLLKYECIIGKMNLYNLSVYK